MRAFVVLAATALLALAGCQRGAAADAQPMLATTSDNAAWQATNSSTVPTDDSINAMIAESANESVDIDQAVAYTNMAEGGDGGDTGSGDAGGSDAGGAGQPAADGGR